eukprot:CAMPEP_0116143276 /NCGR_PEP_ID=MMETSP0329-20121206/15362_1 /TAXON_ID=697910 /ORGANISM="Pseudo-nitzschia arenysensis, Strain B593" /LENGTH=867 /DNA_ID=CAMNT_0003638581 /DNA_START=130 /DNA_END=2730 /DNA_ORIENTATION=-
MTSFSKLTCLLWGVWAAVHVSGFVPRSSQLPASVGFVPTTTTAPDICPRSKLVALSTATSNDTRNAGGNPRNSFNNRDGGRTSNFGRGDGGRTSSFGRGRGGRGGRGRGGRGRGGRGGRDGGRVGRGGGGGRTPMLKLENPMKIQRVEAPPPQRRNNNNNRRDQNSDGDRKPRRDSGQAGRSDGGSKFSPASGGPGGGGGGGGDLGRNDRRKRQPGARRTPQGQNRDGPNRGKTSLRLQSTGRRMRRSSNRGTLRKRDRTAEREARAEAAEERRTISLPEGPISVGALAQLIDEKPVAIIKFLMTDCGVMASMTQNLDPSTVQAVVEGFGKIIAGEDDEYDEDEDDEDDDEYDDDSAMAMGFVAEEEDESLMSARAPVVTIMGHVDHGKTSLLDAIRNTRVTAGEAGGITQHIAAYQVEHSDQTITFIDTPGHAAFTNMRERGANITDIVVLVVAADDGVKQQTADSIVCARQAGVPLVVAINKVDLETADPNRVMTELTGYDILTEEFGGEVMSSQISAKEKTNLDDLLDKIMLQAEIEDLKANPDRDAEAIVIEANVETGLGTVATSLVKKGTLKVGDIFAAGETHGKVRALISTNDGKTRLKEVGPSTPVRIVGFEGIPSAGDPLVVVSDEQTARTLAESRQRIAREKSSNKYQNALMDNISLSFGAKKENRFMYVIVKADVKGSAEALTQALENLKLEDEEAVVTVKVLVSDAGEVSKSDIAIASVTPGTTVIAFNVAASFAAMEDARTSGIPLEYYNIVYDAIESVECRMQEVLSPTPEGEFTGSATVQEVFNIGGTGNIAGSRCTEGILRKGGNVRVMRGDKILTESTIKTLRNFKAETDIIEAGNECGIGLGDFEDFQPD